MKEKIVIEKAVSCSNILKYLATSVPHTKMLGDLYLNLFTWFLEG